MTMSQKNREQENRDRHPVDALAQSKAAMQEGAPAPTPNRNGIGEGITGSYVRNQDRPRVGDGMGVPRPA
jgi:hypothetical protein